MCPPPAAAADDRLAADVGASESVWMAEFAVVLETNDASLGGGDWVATPPIAKTCNCDAVPPFDEVGVPPTVTATNSVAPTEKTAGPEAIGAPVSNAHRTGPVLRSHA